MMIDFNAVACRRNEKVALKPPLLRGMAIKIRQGVKHTSLIPISEIEKKATPLCSTHKCFPKRSALKDAGHHSRERNRTPGLKLPSLYKKHLGDLMNSSVLETEKLSCSNKEIVLCSKGASLEVFLRNLRLSAAVK